MKNALSCTFISAVTSGKNAKSPLLQVGVTPALIFTKLVLYVTAGAMLMMLFAKVILFGIKSFVA